MGILGVRRRERFQIAEIAWCDAVHDAPKVFEAVLDGRPGQAENEIRIERLGRMGVDRPWLFYFLHFVENDDPACNPRKGTMIVRERLIGRQDPIGIAEPVDIQRILRRPVGRLRPLEMFETGAERVDPVAQDLGAR